MKQSITQSQFIDALHNCGRGEQFTYNGLVALYDFLEGMEQDTGTEYELDVIALCCEFTEYEGLEEFQDNYGNDYQSIDDINKETTVIMIDDTSFIIQDF